MFRLKIALGLVFVIASDAVAQSTPEVAPPSISSGTYDPLRTASGFEMSEETIVDAKRKSNIPIRIYMPKEESASGNQKKYPVILFSHGLGGSREAGQYLGEHWSRRGYIGIFLQHPGSDTSTWRDAQVGSRMKVLKEAASGKNFVSRIDDVHCVLDTLEQWSLDPKHPIGNHFDLEHIGMSGHSFGAVTTQAVSGQNYPLIGTRYTDSRIRAALPLSPSMPKQGNGETAFSKVAIPWMLMTGTKDDSPIEKLDPVTRTKVFESLPRNGEHYQIVLQDANHGSFGNSMGNMKEKDPKERYHRAILSLSTAFWDTYLRSDEKARAWLQGEGAKNILIPEDRWEIKRP